MIYSNADTPCILTDGRGQVPPGTDVTEPEIDSVVLTRGEHGLAWQRFARDGKWHRAGSNEVREWDDLLTERDLILIYEAEPRQPEHKRPPSPTGRINFKHPDIQTWVPRAHPKILRVQS